MQRLRYALPLVLCAASAFGQTSTTVTYSFGGYPVYIPVDSADVISIASIVVPDAIKMTKVTVKVSIQYPAVGDLNLYLYSPDGTRVKLLEHNCSGLVNVDTTFDDAATSKYADFCPAEAGRGPFRGNEPLSNFNSADSSIGAWRLAVENNSSDSRAGWLKSYTLQITGASQIGPTFRAETVLNSASARSGVIAPGEGITILGVGLGPSAGATASPGTWPTSLGGVRVSINGIDIPLAYASSFRVDGQVPYDLSVTGPASVQVRNNDATSSTVMVNTQFSVPGIYTTGSLGLGQAKAFNQDGKLNSAQNPARRGEVIAVYAAGLGPVVPASAAGQGGPARPLSECSLAVAATIGGVPATVTFAGLAPGYAGTYQVNIQIPASATPGTREIVISNGGNNSQAPVTIEVQ